VAAWNGLALARALQGNPAGAYDALAQADKVAPTPLDKLMVSRALCWIQASDNKVPAALKTLAEHEKQAETVDPTDWAWSAVERAVLLDENGRTADAVKAANEALARAAKLGLPDKASAPIRAAALAARRVSEEKMNKLPDAKKTLDELGEVVKLRPDVPWVQSLLHEARGQSLLGSGDARGALAEFAQCLPTHEYCHRDRIQALTKARDKAGAEASKKDYLDNPQRSWDYLFVRTRLFGPIKAAAKTPTAPPPKVKPDKAAPKPPAKPQPPKPPAKLEPPKLPAKSGPPKAPPKPPAK
jgi:tetratricopeptide (TPR) repeat protein